MGMSASQARFLCLTARKNNVEFEGQQINQQRTCLSNESASYYSELCNMAVPVPPSVDDYTKVTYKFNDGAMTNTITSLLFDGTNNNYRLSYLQQWQDDYAITPASSSLVMRTANGYVVGDSTLRLIGDATENTQNQGQQQGQQQGQINEYVIIDGSKYNVYRDDNGPYYEKSGGALSANEENMIKYYSINNGQAICEYYKYSDGKTYSINDITHSNPVTINENNYVNSSTKFIATTPDGDNTGTVIIVGLDSNGNHVKLDDDGNAPELEKVYINESQVQTEEITPTPAPAPASVPSLDVSDDDYLNSLPDDAARLEALETEKYYLALLREYTNSNSNFYVRYVKNQNTGAYEPIFYSADELTNTPYNDRSLASVPAYSVGSQVKTREVLNKECEVELDGSGRYVAITVINGEDKRTYSLTTTTTTDETAYNDAMNDYYYQQHEYDHKVQEINSRLEIIQQQDKQLELKLKQLDTEENAISTEMDAVKKVISKNVDSSFKTFSA